MHYMPYEHLHKACTWMKISESRFLSLELWLKAQKRKTLLLIWQTVGAYTVSQNIWNIKVLSLLPNCTSIWQPLIQGIVHAAKCTKGCSYGGECWPSFQWVMTQTWTSRRLSQCTYHASCTVYYPDQQMHNIQGCIQKFQDSTCKKKFAYLGC